MEAPKNDSSFLTPTAGHDTEHQYGLLVSDDLKEWNDMSAGLILPTGLRHGTVIKITGKEFEKLSGFH